MVNRISYKKSEALIPINRKQAYIERLFYLKDYAEEIRTTKISNIYFEKYKENVKTSYSIIDKWRTKLTALNSISSVQEVLFTATCMIYLTFQIAVLNNLSIGKFSALVTASAQLKSSLAEFFGILNEIQNISLQTTKIRSFFKANSYIENNKTHGIALGSTPYSIEIKDLHFQYTEDQCEIQLNDDALNNALKLFDFNYVINKANANLDSQMTKEFDSDGIILSGGHHNFLRLLDFL